MTTNTNKTLLEESMNISLFASKAAITTIKCMEDYLVRGKETGRVVLPMDEAVEFMQIVALAVMSFSSTMRIIESPEGDEISKMMHEITKERVREFKRDYQLDG